MIFLILIMKIFQNLTSMPTNFNLSFLFNGGSFLGLIFFIQILTGLILAILFNPSTENFFLLIELTNFNFFFFGLRFFHMNGASLFFMMMIFHIFRGLYFSSFKKNKLFFSGIVIYLMLMMISFFGYVLPWGQMSFWGSSVITNFLSVIKSELVFFLWGDFSPSYQLMFFFFSLHFILPFVLLMNVIFHIIFLHEISSSNKIFKSSVKKKKLFFFLKKDMNNFFLLFLYYFFVFYYFNLLGDSENFILSNKMVTPNHIKPEWYFLWAYSILRAVPSKVGGVILLVSSILILIKFLFSSKSKIQSKKIFFVFIILILLTFLGGKPVESPFLEFSQLITFLYFFIIFI